MKFDIQEETLQKLDKDMLIMLYMQLIDTARFLSDAVDVLSNFIIENGLGDKFRAELEGEENA